MNSSKIVLYNHRYDGILDFIDRLPTTFDSSGEIIYHDRNVIKKIQAPDGTMLCVKRYRRPRGINLFVYSSGLRKPKGQRAYIYPQVLLGKNIPTPEPIAYIEERNTAGLLGYSYFVSVYCQYAHKMYEAGDARPGSYEELAIAFARFTASVHDKEIEHLDYSPGNILFNRLDDGSYKFLLVDTNRMRFGSVDWRRGCENFKRIWGPKRFFVMVIEEYARCRGIDPDEAVKYALKAREKFWRSYMRRHEVKFKLEF